jgi:CRISPR/Cas system Type II protein with McrA/HNH and RuvC-like nuclease domain
MALRQTFERWEPPCNSKSGDHCFVGDSTVCVNCHLVKQDSLTKKKKRKSMAPSHLPKLIQKQGGKCFYCGVGMWVGSVGKKKHLAPLLATVDHVVPASRGGTNMIDNLVAACRACNSYKGDLLLGEWLDAVAGNSMFQKMSPDRRKALLERLPVIIERRAKKK